MQLSTLAMVAAAVVVGLTAPAAAGESSTTRHKFDACSKMPSPEPDVIEVRRCQGKAGIAVRWMSEPDATSVSFGDNPLQEDYNLGSAFQADEAIEWRSARKGTRPVAAIVRYRTGSVSKLNKTVLVVYRLEPSGASCIMGVVSGANAGGKARRLVDKSAGTFVCGKSAQITE